MTGGQLLGLIVVASALGGWPGFLAAIVFWVVLDELKAGGGQ